MVKSSPSHSTLYVLNKSIKIEVWQMATEIIAGIEMYQRTSTESIIYTTEESTIGSPVRKMDASDDSIGGSSNSSSHEPTMAVEVNNNDDPLTIEVVKSPAMVRGSPHGTHREPVRKTRRASPNNNDQGGRRRDTCVGKKCKVALAIFGGLVGLSASVLATAYYGKSLVA